ncbi:nitroreductase family protein [bacterium]|nr:nitroreductase family protein [bacterium]MCI0602557.1 nitroreductase family protein [bacterium]
MTLRETMISRRSVRSFQSEHPGRERIRELIDMAITAPSASNKQPWRFFVTDDRNTIEKMAQAVSRSIDQIVAHIEPQYMDAFRAYGDYFVRFQGAPVVIAAAFREIAVLSNLIRNDLPKDSFETIRRMEYYSGLTSTSLAIQNLMLYAHSCGLGTSCMTGPLVAAEQLKEILTIPASWDLAALIAVGYSAEEPVVTTRKQAKAVLRWVNNPGS